MVSSLAATMLWGSALPVIKLSYAHIGIEPGDTFEQWLFAGYRFTLAGLMLVLLSMLLNRKRRDNITTLPWPRLLRLGVVQTLLQYLVLYVGLSYSSGVEGSILVGSTSLFQILSARLLDNRERLNAGKWFGLLMGFSGILVIGFAQQGMHVTFGIGSVLLLASAIFGGFGNVLAKRESGYESVISLTGKQMLVGGLGLLILGALNTGLTPFHLDAEGWGLLMYLSLLSAAGFALWNTVMKYNDVGKVSLYLFLIPVFGVLLSTLLLGEKLSIWIGASLLLVVTGIIIANRAGRKKVENIVRN
ncbi:transporter, EamA family [Paenibacillus pini JCM 16418]|uniref:Transporter, EamA family n=1 Tax=Paenibacillus pini JCM 16418 TaxID=1236976 RepID=W7YM50_9BACL|nr:transporter, EamA family [Paenibacillus pini JCM 16418]